MCLDIKTAEVEFSTSEREVKDLTLEVEKKIKGTDVNDGICLIFAPHATGILFLNENEEGIKEDYMKGLDEVVPENNNWKHDRIDNNAHSHIKSALVGTDITVPITSGSLDLGTWQNIFFVETDGPRKRRRLILKIIGKF